MGCNLCNNWSREYQAVRGDMAAYWLSDFSFFIHVGSLCDLIILVSTWYIYKIYSFISLYTLHKKGNKEKQSNMKYGSNLRPIVYDMPIKLAFPLRHKGIMSKKRECI